jgi:Family of unknown function (DUF5681)
MTWLPGQSGNPSGGASRKPFRDAINMELKMFERGEKDRVPRNSPRSLIRAQILKAEKGDLAALQFLAERVEGKATTVVGGDSEYPFHLIAERGDEARMRIEERLRAIGQRGLEVALQAVAGDEK